MLKQLLAGTIVVLLSLLISTVSRAQDVLVAPDGAADASAPSDAVAAAVGVAGAAAAVEATTPGFSDDPGSIAQSIFEALTSGNWKMLALLILVAVLWVGRHYGSKLPKIGKYIGSRRGGAAMALLTGMVGVVGSAAASGAAITWPVVQHGFTVGLGMAGGWSVVKSLIQGERKADEPAPVEATDPPA